MTRGLYSPCQAPKERISFMWDLTAELWSLKGIEYVERRLQRNITNLIKK